MELLRKSVLSEHQRVRWVVEVVNLDLEKLLTPSAKKSPLGALKKKEIKRSTRLRLQWRPGQSLKPWPTKDKTSSPTFDLRDGTVSLEPPICVWVIDGVLKWKDGNVHENLLLWVELISKMEANPNQVSNHFQATEKVVGKAYIDLSKYTPGKSSSGVSVIGEAFDMTIGIRTMTPQDNPHQMDLTLAPSATVGRALLLQEEPADADATTREQWLEANHRKLEGELRRTIIELNRNAKAVLDENEKKKKQLADLKAQLHELQAKGVDKSAGEAATRAKEALERKITAQNALVEALQAELDDLTHQEKDCDCVVT
jgi:hypothetical protein